MLAEVMAIKGGTETSSRNDSADQNTGAELYLPEGSALPAGQQGLASAYTNLLQ